MEITALLRGMILSSLSLLGIAGALLFWEYRVQKRIQEVEREVEAVLSPVWWKTLRQIQSALSCRHADASTVSVSTALAFLEARGVVESGELWGQPGVCYYRLAGSDDDGNGWFCRNVPPPTRTMTH